MPRTHLNGNSRFKDKVALVVGGANGIGRAIALRLACEHASVVIADIDLEGMDETAREIQSHGSHALCIPCDVREACEVRTMVAKIIDTFHQVDILMQIAGIAAARPFLDLDDGMWDETMNVNLRGAFLVAKAVLPHMIARRYGKLVFMSSTNSWDAEAQLAHYSASKAGIFLLAKTMAREFGRYGINSNALGPGLILTRLSRPILHDPAFIAKYDPETGVIPAGRIGTPDDVAGPALFLASEDAQFVNGAMLFVDGGQLA
jgi:NAD(P)-dependent dehydrogenase (short-subunit alcohol dehydrogenase family)